MVEIMVKKPDDNKLNNKADFKPRDDVVKDTEMKRIPSGIDGLDKLIEGGFEKNSNIVVLGGPGTGKTVFGMQFLYNGAKKYNEPGIFISFDETKESILKHHNVFGWDLEKLEKDNLLRFLIYRPHQINKLLQEGGGVIRDVIKSMDAKRVVFDSINAYTLLFNDRYSQRESLIDLFDMLHKWGTTNLITVEESTSNYTKYDGTDIVFLSDALIHLKYDKIGEGLVRDHTLEILKMRGTKHTRRVCAMMFEKNGIKIYSDVYVQ